MRARELREMTGDELHQRLKERQDDIISFRMQLATGVVENVRIARNARRDIARIKTLIKEREVAAQKKSGAKNAPGQKSGE